ncbi:hypothetical protein B0G76_3427 [Paraburkholderia sp. BL23I1N1]|uniref:hypothetical protein n=1 Tax=Paraburkholderia sp. BL23I1N1 TaxID=1938802 RepID=UPI000E7523D9|nr:hypothetical protein [Paraburkholderia sp. BL23I1N1]RKE37190.1 hypothetical protein B0G76_3427 [Paraburkholderia sp. BL23I1N1]
MLRFLGIAALLLTATSTVSAGERYLEIWNPPEARGAMYHVKTAHKQRKRHHAAPHTVKVRSLQTSASVAKLASKQRSTPETLRAKAPDIMDIPRQITPEGNIIRVDSRRASVEVTR